jgi:hypothetical protein
VAGGDDDEKKTTTTENWVVDVAMALANAGERSAHVHEWLAGAAEDVLGADVLPPQRLSFNSLFLYFHVIHL